jgi:hypothetical protein
MKRLALCLVAFAFVASFASAQSQRLGSLAEIEKSVADIFVTVNVGMIDNMRKDTQLYKAYSSMLKSSVMVFYTKKDNVLVILGVKRRATDDPKILQTYYTVFGYAFTRGLEKVKDDTKYIIVVAEQPDGSVYDYFFPTDSLTALIAGSIQMADYEQLAYVATGSALND